MRPASVLVLVCALSVTGPLAAAPELAGRWQVDADKSRQSLNQPRPRPPEEVKTLLTMFGNMMLDISPTGILFNWGDQKVTCGWRWKGSDTIALSNCVDEKQAPAGGVDTLGYRSDTILFYEKDGSALSFSRR